MSVRANPKPICDGSVAKTALYMSNESLAPLLTYESDGRGEYAPPVSDVITQKRLHEIAFPVVILKRDNTVLPHVFEWDDLLRWLNTFPRPRTYFRNPVNNDTFMWNQIQPLRANGIPTAVYQETRNRIRMAAQRNGHEWREHMDPADTPLIETTQRNRLHWINPASDGSGHAYPPFAFHSFQADPGAQRKRPAPGAREEDPIDEAEEEEEEEEEADDTHADPNWVPGRRMGRPARVGGAAPPAFASNDLNLFTRFLNVTSIADLSYPIVYESARILRDAFNLFVEQRADHGECVLKKYGVTNVSKMLKHIVSLPICPVPHMLRINNVARGGRMSRSAGATYTILNRHRIGPLLLHLIERFPHEPARGNTVMHQRSIFTHRLMEDGNGQWHPIFNIHTLLDIEFLMLNDQTELKFNIQYIDRYGMQTNSDDLFVITYPSRNADGRMRPAVCSPALLPSNYQRAESLPPRGRNVNTFPLSLSLPAFDGGPRRTHYPAASAPTLDRPLPYNISWAPLDAGTSAVASDAQAPLRALQEYIRGWPVARLERRSGDGPNSNNSERLRPPSPPPPP